MIRGLIIRLLINALAIYVAAWVISGIHLSGWDAYVLVGAIFAAVNTLIKPIVKFFARPFQLMTLGLITVLVNVLMLYLTDWIANRLELDFSIDNFLSALLGALLIGAVSFALNKIVK